MKGWTGCPFCKGSGYSLARDHEDVDPCLEEPRERRLPEHEAMRKLIDARDDVFREKLRVLDLKRREQIAALEDALTVAAQRVVALEAENRRLRETVHKAARRIELGMRAPSAVEEETGTRPRVSAGGAREGVQ